MYNCLIDGQIPEQSQVQLVFVLIATNKVHVSCREHDDGTVTFASFTFDSQLRKNK